MEQSHFWIIQSINFLLILTLTVINIVVARKTSFAINNLSKINSFELETHYKLLMQFASFLSAIDEGPITIPVIKMDSILSDNAIRVNTMDNLMHAKTEAETSYYKLLMMLSYSKTADVTIENNINVVIQQYRNMHDNLLEGLTQKYRYINLHDKDNKYAYGLLRSVNEALAEYSRIRETFVKQKDDLTNSIRIFVKAEKEAIRKQI